MLRNSSQGWHEGKHDPRPYIGYLLFILKEAYRELEDRVGKTTAPRGEKTEIVTRAIENWVPRCDETDREDLVKTMAAAVEARNRRKHILAHCRPPTKFKR